MTERNRPPPSPSPVIGYGEEDVLVTSPTSVCPEVNTTLNLPLSRLWSGRRIPDVRKESLYCVLRLRYGRLVPTISYPFFIHRWDRAQLSYDQRLAGRSHGLSVSVDYPDKLGPQRHYRSFRYRRSGSQLQNCDYTTIKRKETDP